MDPAVARTDQNITVLIADDHPIVRSGLRGALGAAPDISVIGEARDGAEAVEKALALTPDVIIIDIFMPHLNGLQAMLSIKEKLADVKFLVMTISEDQENLLEAIKFGAHGYFLKRANVSEIVDAVRKIAAGGVVLSPDMAARLVGEFLGKKETSALTEREREVMCLMGEGLSTAEMAERLYISVGTVSTHVYRILNKLHLKNRAEGIAYAIRNLPRLTPEQSAEVQFHSRQEHKADR